jgi:hypothetical protein
MTVRLLSGYSQTREIVMNAANYSATDELRDGRKVEIRALRPEDRTDLLAAIGRAGKQSIFQRFFAFKRGFTEEEIDFYVNVDFVRGRGQGPDPRIMPCRRAFLVAMHSISRCRRRYC